jgi:hypothetical protein
MAVIEEFTRIDERGAFRVKIRRCVSLSRDRPRKRRKKKDAGLRSTRRCGDVEIVSEELISRTA